MPNNVNSCNVNTVSRIKPTNTICSKFQRKSKFYCEILWREENQPWLGL